MKLLVVSFLSSLVTGTCIFESSTRLLGSEITSSNAEIACGENTHCYKVMPLVSYEPGDDLSSRISCESSSKPVRNCSSRAIVADSVSSLLDFPLHESLPSVYWTNSDPTGAYQECTQSPSSRYLTSATSSSDVCQTTLKLLCLCLWYQNTSYTLWSVRGLHLKRLSGEFIHCNESLPRGTLVYRNSELSIYSPDTVALANGTNLTSQWESFQAVNTTLARLESGTFKITSNLPALAGLLVNDSCVAETTLASNLVHCPDLSAPFSVICSQEFAKLGGDEGTLYLAIASVMDFLGVPYPPLPATGAPSRTPSVSPTRYPTLAPTRSPSQSPASRIPSASPTSSYPSTSPTKSPRKSTPTHSPSRSPTKSPSRSPTKSPTKAPVVG